MATLSVCVQGRTATFPECVSTCPAVWACIYMSVFQWVLCAWMIVSNHVSTSVCVHAFSFTKFWGFIGCCALVDEVTEGLHVFLFLPASGQLPAGFPQTIKSVCLPVAPVITPPIRAEEWRGIPMSEESEDDKAAITAWTLICMCVDKALSWARSQFQRMKPLMANGI